MLETLDQLVEEIGGLNSKLLLLVGARRSGKISLLSNLAKRRRVRVLNVGSALGRQLLAIPNTRRHVMAAALFKDLADDHAVGDLLLLGNIELLFDRTLQLDPIDLLKRHAHSRRVVAVWPGELNNDRLIYATMGHPEYKVYGVEGLVPFEIY